MGDRPILFSAPMVRALLDGRKTQTRRLIKPRGPVSLFSPGEWADSYILDPGNAYWRARDIRFNVGDRLWVKETWRVTSAHDDIRPSLIPEEASVEYVADGPWRSVNGKTRVSIFMPRWASRLTLIVTDVRVQRLQEISEADAVAEGVESHAGSDGPIAEYEALWEAINGPDTWSDNPWIVAVSFTVDQRNIDA